MKTGVRGQGPEAREKKPIIIIVRMVRDIPNISPKKLEQDPVGCLKQWAAEFKAEMENDPDFGRFVKVEIGVEEG